MAHSVEFETPLGARGQTRVLRPATRDNERVVRPATRDNARAATGAALPPVTPVTRARSPSAQARRPLNNSVRHFSTTWGSRGSGQGNLDTPTGLSILGDTQVGRVQRYSDLQLLMKIGAQVEICEILSLHFLNLHFYTP